MKFTPGKALKEFVSTFKEWHYFVGGASMGFVLGWIFGSIFSLISTSVE